MNTTEHPPPGRPQLQPEFLPGFLPGPDAGDLVRLATDHLYSGTEHGDPDQLAAATATAYALVAIADSLHRLADRHAPDLATLRPARDDR